MTALMKQERTTNAMRAFVADIGLIIATMKIATIDLMAPATRNLTILMTDIKDFTGKTSSRSRDAISALLKKHKDIVLPILLEKGGTLIKTMGDAFLMTFESPTDAVLAGVAVQAALSAHNGAAAPEHRIEVRVVINQGEVNLVEGDVFGEPVNITARLETVALAGEIWLTDAVHLAMNKSEVRCVPAGFHKFKGIPEKVRAWKVAIQPAPVQEPAYDPEHSGIVFYALVAVIILVFSGLAFFSLRPEPGSSTPPTTQAPPVQVTYDAPATAQPNAGAPASVPAPKVPAAKRAPNPNSKFRIGIVRIAQLVGSICTNRDDPTTDNEWEIYEEACRDLRDRKIPRGTKFDKGWNRFCTQPVIEHILLPCPLEIVFTREELNRKRRAYFPRAIPLQLP